jgi:hypothetical protein
VLPIPEELFIGEDLTEMEIKSSGMVAKDQSAADVLAVFQQGNILEEHSSSSGTDPRDEDNTMPNPEEADDASRSLDEDADSESNMSQAVDKLPLPLRDSAKSEVTATIPPPALITGPAPDPPVVDPLATCIICKVRSHGRTPSRLPMPITKFL